MNYPIDLYYEPDVTDDLLFLTYIVSGNVKKITYDSNDVLVVPIVEDSTLFKKVIDSFSSFIKFYEEIQPEGEYKQEIDYFKQRFNQLSFISAHDLYKKLKEGKESDSFCYTMESSAVGIRANDLATVKGFEFAPDVIAGFYKKYDNKTKYKKLTKEAKKFKISHSL